MQREVVVASQRARLLDAMADAVARKGYAATTVADVVGGAGISRKTFYEHFAGKLECFLAAYDEGVEGLLAKHESAWNGPGSFAERQRAAVETYLRALAAAPEFARTVLIETPAAGPVALERRAAVHARFAAQLRAAYAERSGAPPEAFAAAVGAVHELVYERVRQGRIETLPELAGTLQAIQSRLLG